MSRPSTTERVQAPARRGHDDPSVWAFSGDRYTVKAAAEDTDGALGLVEAVIAPGSGPPAHLHRNEDELFYLVDGRLEVTVDGESRDAVTVLPGGEQRLTAAHGLSDGPHLITVQLRSEPSTNPPELLQAIVSRRPLQSWVYPWIFAALTATLALVAGSLVWSLLRDRRRPLASG